ncbi:MAG: hypothetical protein NVSMB62_23260 [Acidobacteriaceae bacterium]
MRLPALLTAALLVTSTLALPSAHAQAGPAALYTGFDRNLYPGDAALPELHRRFAFTGFWLTNPPGESSNTWAGKREILRRTGFGFLVVANGKLDRQILAARRSGTPPSKLGQQDAATAIATARREGFPPQTILFLDQEEGGRLLPEQADYLLAWTEAVAANGFRPGVYASAQPVPDGAGPNGKPATITTVQDIRARVAAAHLHAIAFWAAQDGCPPAPGCVVQPPPPDASGTPGLTAWQYAQSPRRPDITRACAATYDRDGNCYSPAPARFFIDLSSSTSPDPSHGR